MQSFDSSLGIPAFLSKLWKMVEDPKTDHIICWSKDGKTFIIKSEQEFWYTLLPHYYKHNNMSSFVRQLNMYGFHKISNIDNDEDEDERIVYQFLHPYFQRGEHQLLKDIKRKVTASKVVAGEKSVHNIENKEQFSKVITDVKNLYGRQAHVDTVLNNLREENAVLWRELAVLRQKHQKQQQIVNKLIQFLVTIVQPARMGGLGGKKRFPLMIHESPEKKQKTSASDGPTIHELDSTDVVPEELFETHSELHNVQGKTTTLNAGKRKIDSPASTSRSKSPSVFLNEDDAGTSEPTTSLGEPNFPITDSASSSTIELRVDELLKHQDLFKGATNIDTLQVNPECENDDQNTSQGDKVFVNPTSQDDLLANLINRNSNGNSLDDSKNTTDKKDNNNDDDNMAVARRDPSLIFSRLNSVEDIDNHVGSTQDELDQLKEFLNGCSGIDSSYLLNLFNDDSSSCGINKAKTKDEGDENEMLSSQLAPYDSNIVDFNELFDDSVDNSDFLKSDTFNFATSTDESINTPDVSENKPIFPPDDQKE